MKSLFISTLLAAALMGGQVFAATPTKVDGATVDNKDFGVLAGVYGENAEATGGQIHIYADPSGRTDLKMYDIASGFTYSEGMTASAYSNKLTMDSGEVIYLHGGLTANGDANNNTVVIQGGTVASQGIVYGGCSSCLELTGTANNNVVIISGGNFQGVEVEGGFSGDGIACGNRVHLVGRGAKDVGIADADGKVGSYTGSSEGLQFTYVIGGWSGVTGMDATVEDNYIDIYGSGVNAKAIGGLDHLQFHLVESPADTAPMLTLTSSEAVDALNMSGIQLNLFGDAVTDWAAYVGESITLVQAAQAIQGLTDGTEVDIKDADGAVLATATLMLGDSNKTLSLENIKGVGPTPGPVPEPTTSTLSLLALVALAARRRKTA